MNAKPKWTPGPWQVFECPGEAIQINCKPMVTVAEITTPAVHFTDFVIDEARANARLIAAAPEMAELLQQLADRTTGFDVAKVVAEAERILAEIAR